jgi:predicted amidohydrolase
MYWHHVRPGAWYQVVVAARATDVPHLHDNVHAELIWWDAKGKRTDWAHVRFQPDENGVLRFAQCQQAPADAVYATLRLMLRWADRGKVVWCGPLLGEIPEPKPRTLTAAIATGKFPGESIESNMAFVLDLIARAADAGADVVCLPECITTWRTKDLPHEGARPIPGRETDQLCQAAARRYIDVVGSIYELNGKLIHNTGLYVDRDRGILGKYRKVHLAVGERWKGITPGDDFPVWETRYGRVGMLICYDSVMGEAHRILAQKGAEVLFMPIMGDPRAVGDAARENWRRIMQVRAMDNHVWFVVCQNAGEWGLIARPDGQIAAEVDPASGIATAELDLGFRFQSWIGSDFRNRVWGERRPHLYDALVREA